MTHLFDATTVIDLLAEGPGHRFVESLFPAVAISAVNWLEVLRWSIQNDVAVEAWTAELLAAGLVVLPFTVDDAGHGPRVRAAEAQVRAGRPARDWRGLSTADVAFLATATARDLVAVSDDALAAQVAALTGLPLVNHREQLASE